MEFGVPEVTLLSKISSDFFLILVSGNGELLLGKLNVNYR